jgi:hypothetical protein
MATLTFYVSSNPDPMTYNTPATAIKLALTATLLLSSLTLTAQEKGIWRAESNTARSITGDVTLADEKLTINFSSFPMARIRTLDKSEVSAAFDADSNAEGAASLYRITIPYTKKFLHHNSLCGSEDTQWMVTYVSGHTLQLAFLSGEKAPVFTPEAFANSTALCGTFSYGK